MMNEEVWLAVTYWTNQKQQTKNFESKTVDKMKSA